MTKRVRPALVLWAVLSSVLAACGQKGPLYMPGNTGEMQTIEAPADGDATEDERDGEETSCGGTIR